MLCSHGNGVVCLACESELEYLRREVTYLSDLAENQRRYADVIVRAFTELPIDWSKMNQVPSEP